MNTSSIADSAKGIIESLVTSGYPVDEILQQLQSSGIECYVTENGDLMVKYWQVGAEGLVPFEHLARIRASQSAPTTAEPLEWLSANLDHLRAQYTGRWIAIVSHEVVASAPDLPSLLALTSSLEGVTPFITQIPAEPVSWLTSFPDADSS